MVLHDLSVFWGIWGKRGANSGNESRYKTCDGTFVELIFARCFDSESVKMSLHNSRVYFLAITTSMGAFLFGYDLAFIGTTIELEPFQK